jgi:uncharacterized membrane protein
MNTQGPVETGRKRRVSDTLGERVLTFFGGSRRRRASLMARLRSYFLTGLVIAAPVSITVYVTWWFIGVIDQWFKPLLPAAYDPDSYLPFSIPGVGLVVALVLLTLLGGLAANLLGRTVVGFGEQMLDQMPVVRNIYRALKQIFETVLSQSNQSFREVGLVEYPRRDIWALVFLTTETTGEVAQKAGKGQEPGDRLISVFMPTTPNPTSGFLLFVPDRDVIRLKMTIEDGAKMVISAGLVVPGGGKTREQIAEEAKGRIKELAKVETS